MICPIRGTEHYIDVAVVVYFAQQSLVVEFKMPPLLMMAEARIKLYLEEMGQDEGETLYRFRSGCEITLALSGVELTEIMDHVGRSSKHC